MAPTAGLGQGRGRTRHADISLPLPRSDSRPGQTTAPTAIANPRDGAAMSAARFWSAFAVLFLLAALPVLSVELPPLFHYPNHLARMDLLARLPGSEALQRHYEPHWLVIPHLGMDLVVPTLVRFLPLAWAGQAFVLAGP